MISDKFVILASLFNVYGSASYIINTLKGRTKPNRVTWLFWALAPLVAFAAEVNKGVGLRSLMTFMVGFGPLIVLLTSFANRKSYWQLKKFDFVCGTIALMGLALWALTREGNLAILFSILADAFAALPTLVKSYKAPETEDWVAYGAVVISSGITLMTINQWTFANYGFPVYVFVICILFTFFIKSKIGRPQTAK